MKAKELRIGNLVTAITCNRTTEADQIVMINAFGLIETTFGWSEVEPIPLDEEWMNKLGFIYDGCDYDYFDNEKEFREFESRNGLGSFIELDGYFAPKPFYFSEAFGENLKLIHVHQLQNLYFALTGEELTIK